MDENGASSYLTSDYEGLSAEFLEQQPAAGDLRRVAMELAAALAYIHQQQVVLLVRHHRAARPSGAYRSRCLQPLCATLCLHSRLGRQSHLYLRVVLSSTYPCGGECRQSRLRQSRRLQRHHRDPHQHPVSASCTARIPRSVTSLSDEAFNFFYLDSLTIPRQITRIGPWTLACYIKRLHVESPVPPVFDSPAPGTAVTDSSALIFVPRGSLKAYQRADGWRQLSSRLRENP